MAPRRYDANRRDTRPHTGSTARVLDGQGSSQTTLLHQVEPYVFGRQLGGTLCTLVGLHRLQTNPRVVSGVWGEARICARAHAHGRVWACACVAGFPATLPPAVAHRLLLTALTAGGRVDPGIKSGS